MPLKYATLQEHEIRLLTIRPKQPSDTTIHCDLQTLSLQKPNGPLTGKKIPFEGLIRKASPEIFHVIATPKERGIRSRGKSRLRNFLGLAAGNEADINPRDKPESFDFALTTSQGQSQVEYLDGASEELPQNWTPRYEWGDFVALSYTWGDPKATREIIVHQENHQEKHGVTVNLHAALIQLQSLECFNKGLKLWVDALCINQKCETEKKVQCARMDQIYRNAGNIIVWLGPQQTYYENQNMNESLDRVLAERLSSAYAIRFMEWLSRYYRIELLEYLDKSRNVLQAMQFREVVNFKLRQSLRAVIKSIRDDFHLFGFEEPELVPEYGWLSIFHFFDNPYWKRLWIIQELVMGNEDIAVVCGDRITGWRHIRDSALIITGVSDFVSHKIQIFAQANNLKLPTLSGTAIGHVAAIAELGIMANRKALPPVGKNILEFSSKPGPESLPRVRGSGIFQLITLASQAHCFMPKDRVFGLLQVPPFRSLDQMGKDVETLQELYTQSALCCIASGDHSTVFGLVQDNFTQTWREFSTVNRDGALIRTSDTEQYISNGMTHSLDLFSLVDGFANELMLPSWVPDLGAPSWRRTWPFVGPWHASGFGQGVQAPTIINNISVPWNSSGAKGLLLRGTMIDTITGLGAVQPLMRQRMRFNTSSSACRCSAS
jgi:hypothetical protein